VISSVFHRRRAERLSQLIDEASGGRRHHVRSGVDDNLADLVSVSRRLSDLPVKVEAHPEFRDGLRAMLLATIEREGIGATAVASEPEAESAKRRGARIPVVGGALRRPGGSRPPMARRTKARGAIVIGLAAGTLALSGMSAASGDAIPGDPLYSVKRSTERAQLALAGSDISRGQLYLEFARTRLDEARAVKSDPTGFSRVLDDMDSETKQGVKLLTTTALEHKDAAALDAVDAFVSAQRGSAEQLRQDADGPSRARAATSLGLLDDIQKRSKALRLVLKCGSAATGTPDALGPSPKGSCKGSPTEHSTGTSSPNSSTGGTGTGQSDKSNRQTGDSSTDGQSPADASTNVPVPGNTTAPPEVGPPTSKGPGTNGSGSKSGGLLDGLHNLVNGG
jgi:hypothetical protein